jgi:hypothetical protein
LHIEIGNNYQRTNSKILHLLSLFVVFSYTQQEMEATPGRGLEWDWLERQIAASNRRQHCLC